MIGRAGWLLLALFGLALLFIARALEPSTSGLGTHQALGLPPCGFLLYFERPCPGCGLTTAFAHLARFEFIAALRANAAGALLFMLNLGAIALGLLGTFKGLRLLPLLESKTTRYTATLTLSALAAGWLINLIMWEAI